MRLFNAVVRDVWDDRKRDSTEMRDRVERRIADLKKRIDLLEQAFIYDRSID